MKKFKIFLLSFILLLTSYSYAELNIVFVDLDLVIQKSKAGILARNDLDKNQEKNNNYFKKKSEDLKNKENELLSKKNLINETEFNKEVNNLKKKINDFQNERKKMINDIQQKRIKYLSIFAKKINPILSDYSKKNSISMIIDKKNIVVGKGDLDITSEILKIVDNEITKIEIK